MKEEEKKAIEELEEFIKGPCETCKYCEAAYKLNRKNIIQLLNLTKKLQKENKELKEKENKIYKEVQERLAFEKFLIVKERKPDLFNQGRFYISQIIYDILNDVQNPEGIHKENKCIQYIDYISVQKIKDKIKEIGEKIKYEENEKVVIYLHKQKNILQELLESEE